MLGKREVRVKRSEEGISFFEVFVICLYIDFDFLITQDSFVFDCELLQTADKL